MARKRIQLKTITNKAFSAGAGLVADMLVDKGLSLAMPNNTNSLINGGVKFALGIFGPGFIAPRSPVASDAGLIVAYEGLKDAVNEAFPQLGDAVSGLGYANVSQEDVMNGPDDGLN